MEALPVGWSVGESPPHQEPERGGVLTDGSPFERPVIYEVDARLWLREESARERRPVTLESLPPATLDSLADLGFRWVWLTGIWETGTYSTDIHRRSSSSLERFQQALPDVTLEDIGGSPFAVSAYRVPATLGGDEGLEAFRTDLARRDMRLLVDFVAGRTGVDHVWTREHPEFLVTVSEVESEENPSGCWRAVDGRRFEHARDAAGRPLKDALALNPRVPALRESLIEELESVALRADGIRILDAQALLLPEESGEARSAPGTFWTEAIARLRARVPHVVLLADEHPLLREASRGAEFDFYLSDGLVDLLVAGEAPPLRDHLLRNGELDATLLASLERLGGQRSAEVFTDAVQPAAAVVAYLTAGGALLVDGQIEGRRRRQCPELLRRAEEPPNKELQSFYETLLEVLGRPEVAQGRRALLPVREAWEGNRTHDQFLVVLHQGDADQTLLTAVNYGPRQGQCYVDLSCLETPGHEWIFQDLMSLAVYPRDGGELRERGLYLDLGPWDYNVFDLSRGRAG